MDQSVTAAEANRSFSHLLRDVREGASFVVTVHGKPVARIVPADEAIAGRAKARAALMRRLRSQVPATDIGPWTRDDLYDR
ncbi:type II toxin-antitoxin system Phd/YefM family antitoxin [Rhodopila sp.]|jgi:prevent-host-death family protein|uniref:type II toxin-antitoxin system Phd/YefM family antitoxin n=1 Tax=Rhodopila sp. TaxID=2480087 RepID=UPI002CF3EA6F|nr:type II toxin-antitoxin system prevent-host-death family antitoxin [Rhodopila sp.]HVZ10787.1 type II toxin-antitoxin system prevent-host-death family antitoxin [Rhodopila sp.]